MLDPKKEVFKLFELKGWNHNSIFDSENLKEIARESLYNFEEWKLIVKYLKPLDTVPIMNTYAIHVNKLHDVRDAFEYASTHEQKHILKDLLTKHGTDDLLYEWITVYQFIFEILSNSYTLEETLERTKNLYGQVHNPLARMRLDVVELMTHFKLGNVRNVLFSANKLRNDFSKINPSYMKSALASRISLLIGLGKLYGEADFRSAEDYLLAVNVNDATPDTVRASSYHALSNTKLIGNKELCLEYNKNAISYAEQSGLLDFKKALEHEQLPFIKNLYGEIFEITASISEKEQVHQYVVRNETDLALKMITQLENKGLNNDFLLYYKGKALKDVNILIEALSKFCMNGRADMVPVVQLDILSIK